MVFIDKPATGIVWKTLKKLEKQGITGAFGYRYWTMIVENLEEIMADCEAYGSKIITPITTIRPGVTIGIVSDPEGNLVEFVEQE